MAKKKNPLVFMDVSIDGDPVERMVFELFYDVAPKTAENFRALSTGERGVSPNTGKSLHYKGSFFHRVIKGSIVKGGDFVNRNGTGGESIYGSNFPDESPRLKHDAPGLLSMAIADRHTFGSHFIITLKADHHLDRKHVVFGKLVEGLQVLKRIEDVGNDEGHPTVTVKIINCGEYNDDGKKVNKSKTGKDASNEGNNHETRKKGKHKRSSKDRRKRRRYHSSESESSSDSDTESSETDSDSDSDLSSSSDISSSSDDRRRKRKRSKKDKYKRGKRRDKRRDRRRRRRDKRSKRRSKRESGSDSDSESNSSSDGESLDTQQKELRRKDRSHKKAEVKSLSAVEKDVPTIHHKKEEVDMPESKETIVKENGERYSNGTGAAYRSDRSEERQPDVMDDHLGKSRSRSMSPARPMSKSMSISPRRTRSKSRSITPKRRLSKSPSLSRSPPRPSRRSLSRSPVRVIGRSRSRSINRSPVRGRRGRNVSRSPVITRPLKSVSKSPVRSRRSRSSPRASSRKTISRSPVRVSRKSVSRSPVRSPARSLSKSPVRVSRKSLSRSPVRSTARSLSRSSGRVPSKRSISRSPVMAPSRNNRLSYSRSPSPVRRRTSRGVNLSRSASPDASPKRIRRGRGFSERYSYARRYRTPSRSPVRSYRYNGRIDRDRYSNYRRYSPRRFRSPPPRGRTPPRYRRRSRTPSVSPSPHYRARRYSRSRSPVRIRSPVRSTSPGRSRPSPRVERHSSYSRSRSPAKSRSFVESPSPRKASRDRSGSSSRSPDGKKGLVSYGDGSPDSGQSNDMLKDSNARVSKTVLVKLGCGLSSGVIAVFGRIGEHCLCLPCFR
ncbi:peptidylprolyl isomerase [Trifolium repens]|nr:peptidylprolyl isomerase [Trifolium repens]